MRGNYIRGKRARAACDLIDKLSEAGVAAQVGYPSVRRDKRLYVYVHSTANLERVPREFRGFAVEVRSLEGL